MSGPNFRLPPQNLEAEQGVLGSALLDNEVLHEIVPLLKVEDFYRDTHQVLYRTIRELYDLGKPIDVITLAEELTRRDQFKSIGGDETLEQIVGSVPHAANAKYYAEIVRQKSVARRLIDALSQSLSECYGNLDTSEAILERAEERVFAIGEGSATGETRPLSEVALDAWERIGRRNQGEYSGLDTGFSDLDALTDGLSNASLVILAARPSMGKTALALQVAARAVWSSGVDALFVSLEMADIELAERLLVSESRIDGHRVRTGAALRPSEAQALGRAYETLRDTGQLWIDDTALRTVGQIAANARRIRARQRLGLVVIDYAQLVESGDESAGRSSRQEQVAAISRRLKMLAKALDCPVLLLSQLNRNSENREDRRPRLSDLRESGALEQDADMVLLLHRPEFYDPNDQPGVAELIIAKNRNGSTGVIKLAFLKHLARFENYSPFVPPGHPDEADDLNVF